MTILTILGVICLFLGLIGCIVPAIPGPPLSFLALILLEIATQGEAFTTSQLIFWGVVTIIVTVIDYVIPLVGAKKFGATKFGIFGSIIGMVIGIIFFPPLGMLVGAFIGAVAGEFLKGKSSPEAFKAGWGVFVGTMLGIGIKLAASAVMSFYFIKALF